MGLRIPTAIRARPKITLQLITSSSESRDASVEPAFTVRKLYGARPAHTIIKISEVKTLIVELILIFTD
jgi:hypothetical protein